MEENLVAVARIYRAHLPPSGPASSSFLVADPDVICENFEKLIGELMGFSSKERRQIVAAGLLESIQQNESCRSEDVLPKDSGSLWACEKQKKECS